MQSIVRTSSAADFLIGLKANPQVKYLWLKRLPHWYLQCDLLRYDLTKEAAQLTRAGLETMHQNWGKKRSVSSETRGELA